MRYLTDRLEDIIAGFITTGIGIFIVVEATNYKLGTLLRMGPGYFPMILGSTMILLGAIMVLMAKPSTIPQSVGRDQLRGSLFVAAGFIAFALTVESLGMLVSVFLVVFLSALGNRNTPLLTSAVLAVSTAVVSVLIFRVGLDLQIEAF